MRKEGLGIVFVEISRQDGMAVGWSATEEVLLFTLKTWLIKSQRFRCTSAEVSAVLSIHWGPERALISCRNLTPKWMGQP